MDKTILQSLADNPMLFDAVKKLLESRFELTFHEDIYGLEDKRIGEMVRAKLTGLKRISDAFDEIATYKSIKSKPTGENPAR